MDEKIKQALVNGVISAVSQSAAARFNVYRQEHKKDLHQQERTANGLIEIVFAAEEMLELIDELGEREAKA
jgi:hypothetical protein